MTGDSLSLCRLGRVRPGRRFPALICPHGEEDCNRPYVRRRRTRSGASEVTWPASALFEPANVTGDIVYAGDPRRRLPFIEDVDHPPLEVLSPKDGVLLMAAAPGRVSWGDPFVVAMADYDDELAVG